MSKDHSKKRAQKPQVRRSTGNVRGTADDTNPPLSHRHVPPHSDSGHTPGPRPRAGQSSQRGGSEPPRVAAPPHWEYRGRNTAYLLPVDLRFFWIMEKDEALLLSALRDIANGRHNHISLNWYDKWFPLSRTDPLLNLWSRQERGTLLTWLELQDFIKISRSRRTNSKTIYLRICWDKVHQRLDDLEGR